MVHYRVGSLEKFLRVIISQPRVHYRVGSLENHGDGGGNHRIVHYRVGSLEIGRYLVCF